MLSFIMLCYVMSKISLNNLIKLSHKIIIMFPGHLYLVFDFMDTDLSRIIRSDQFMTKGHVQYILYQLLLGVKYLHTSNVIHR